VRFLLMGGQACILYGAAEFSRDLDLVVLADEKNLERLQQALDDLQAEPDYVPAERPLLSWAIHENASRTERGLRAEEGQLRAADRAWWQPLRDELFQLRQPRRREKARRSG